MYFVNQDITFFKLTCWSRQKWQKSFNMDLIETTKATTKVDAQLGFVTAKILRVQQMEGKSNKTFL